MKKNKTKKNYVNNTVNPIIDTLNQEGYTNVTISEELGITAGAMSHWRTGHRVPCIENVVMLKNYINDGTFKLSPRAKAVSLKSLESNLNLSTHESVLDPFAKRTRFPNK